MAVKINDTASLRKSKRWNEEDDAVLGEIVHKKIKEVNLAIREASSPYAKARLKSKREQYKKLRRKIESGTYNGDIIFGEMQAAAMLRADTEYNNGAYGKNGRARKYLNSYENMDLDYETTFRKMRYFGFSLPFLMTILVALFLAVYLLGAFLPVATKANLFESSGIMPDCVFLFKLGPDDEDFTIANNGNWPSGVYASGYSAPEAGVPYVLADGSTPEYVSLYKDLNMTMLHVTTFDIVKSWFRTKMLEKTRLDFLENNENFQGTSWYYAKFLDQRADFIKIEKNAEGNYDVVSILRHIAAYGSIIFLIAAFILGFISLILCICRIFTYTSRKFHWINFLAFLFSALAFVCPALLTLETMDGIGAAFSSYFSFNFETFLQDPAAMVIADTLSVLPTALMLITLILPFLFKNRLKKRPTFVPKGNRQRNAVDDPFLVDSADNFSCPYACKPAPSPDTSSERKSRPTTVTTGYAMAPTQMQPFVGYPSELPKRLGQTNQPK